MSNPMTIGRLARRAGVGVDTVRHYERIGLMPSPARTPAGYRQYGDAELERLRFIRQSKRLGFTLDETARLLELVDSNADRAQVRAMASARLAAIEHDMAELAARRDTLAALVDACRGHGTTSECPIIGAVLAADTVQNTDPPPVRKEPG